MNTRVGGGGRPPVLMILACAAAVVAPVAAGAPPGARTNGSGNGLSHVAPLARAYDLILDARFAEAGLALDRACGPAPAAACEILRATSLWWRIQMTPEDRGRDPEFRAHMARALEDAEAWTGREPDRAEAWFYLGAAYGVRAGWRVLRGERLSAARDGKRIKNALERSLALDPGLADAHFGIGLYEYYADVAPTAFKLLRWLLLLPGGDRREGLREMRQARQDGELIRGEATYQLHLIDLWYERQPHAALDLLAELRAAYPHNPLFYLCVARVHDTYLHDREAALATYRALRDAARDHRVELPAEAEAWAERGLAGARK